MGTLAAGIKEIFATAKTTGSNVMLCGNDGTPDGHMTMANLASVLGVLLNTGSSIDDCDLAPLNMAVYVQVNAHNYPTQLTSSSSGFVYTISNMNGSNVHFRSQIFWSYGENRVFFRCQNDSVWSSWMEYSFDYPSFYKNYADLSSLANALGVYRGNIMTDEPITLAGAQYGYGLLIITNLSNGGSALYLLNAFSADKISGNASATVTKEDEYVLKIQREAGKTTQYVLIAC